MHQEDRHSCGGGVEINSDIDPMEWSRFVADHPYGTIFHTPPMYEVYKQTERQIPYAIAITKYGRIKGLVLAVVQWNGNALTRAVTARSIIIGGPLVVNNDERILNELLREYKKQLPLDVIYTEIRPIANIESISDILVRNGFKRKGHYNILLHTGNHVPDIWNRMHKERKRNIGQAEKIGLRFEEIRTAEGRKQVIELIQKTYRRKHVPLAHSSLFEKLANIMTKHTYFFGAYYNDEMIAGQIRLGYKKLLYAWYAGSDERYFKMRPNDFLMWNVIQWAHRNGYKWFDFGGGGEPGVKYGVRDYKLKYGCEMYDYGRYTYAHRPVIFGLGTIAYKMYHKIKGK